MKYHLQRKASLKENKTQNITKYKTEQNRQPTLFPDICSYFQTSIHVPRRNEQSQTSAANGTVFAHRSAWPLLQLSRPLSGRFLSCFVDGRPVWRLTAVEGDSEGLELNEELLAERYLSETGHDSNQDMSDRGDNSGRDMSDRGDNSGRDMSDRGDNSGRDMSDRGDDSDQDMSDRGDISDQDR